MTNPAAMTTYAQIAMPPRLLGKLVGANFNTTADQPITIRSTNYLLREIIVTNASVSMTTAVGGFYTGANKTGTVLVLATQVYTALTAASKWVALTLAAIVSTDRRTESVIYFALTTPKGTAASADIYLLGDALT